MANSTTFTSDRHQEHFFNGTFLERFNALITEAAGTVTLTLTEVNAASNLTMVFSDGFTLLSTTSLTIALTVGASDAAPQANHIYILQSGKVLVKHTSQWPTAEHIKVAYIVVPSAARVAALGVHVNQNWNEGNDGQGHLTDLAFRERLDGAKYFSGVDPAGTSDYLTIVGAGNVEFKLDAGVVLQMHPHAFGAVDTSTGSTLLVKNEPGDNWADIVDLFSITQDSGSVSLTNKWCTLVFWGIANREQDFVVCNLPSGSYATEAKALEDAGGKAGF